MRDITTGASDQSVIIRIVDSASGTEETGVTGDASATGLALWYRREGGLRVDITPVTTLSALDAAHSASGFIHISDGYYRIDPVDNAFAAGADGVLFGGCATNMVVIGSYYPLVGYNPRTELTTARITNLDNLDASISGLDDTPLSAIRTEVDVALSAIGLDHLVSTTVAGTDVTDNSIIAKMVSKSGTADWDTFVNTTDALEAIADGVTALDDTPLSAIRSEVDVALSAIGLDHLLSVEVAGADITDNTVIAKIVSSSAQADWDTFVNTTDSLQSIRDRGDAAWVTADVNGLATSTNVPDIISLNNISTQAGDALSAIGLDHMVNVAVAGTDITDNSIIAKIVSLSAQADWDTFDNTTDSLEALQAEHDSTQSAALTTSQVRNQVTEGLSAIGLDHLLSAAVVGADVTDNTVVAYLVSSSAQADWDTFVNTTESLQAIRDRGDASWITADVNGLATSTNVPDIVSLANIRNEITDGLSIIGLDHLVSAEVAGADVTDRSIIAYMVSSSAQADWDTFDNTTDSLEAVSGAAGLNTSQVRNQVDEGLSAIGLDHLISVSVAGADVADNSIVAQIVSSSAQADWDTFVNTDDSLQAISESGAAGLNTSQVRNQIDEGLSAIGLDHLMSVAVVGTDITDNTVIAYMVSSSAQADWDTFDNTTDALEAVAGAAGLNTSQVRQQVDEGLSAIGLDHLMNTAVVGADVTDNTVIAYLVSSSAQADWDTFVNTTDALQAIRDRGDASWITADVNGLATSTNVPDIVSLANIRTQADDSLSAIGLDHLVSTTVAGTDVADNSIIAQIVSLSAQADWDTFVNTTDSLQAIRDRGDSAWITATGFSTFDNSTDRVILSTATASQVDDIQSTVNGLQDLSTSQVRNQVTEGLSAIGLDHLLSTTVTGTDITDNSIIAKIVSSSAQADWDTFDNTTDALEAISGAAGLNTSQVRQQVDEGLSAINLDHLLSVAVTSTDVIDNSVIAKIVSSSAQADWDTFVNSDDSLQAISEAGAVGLTTSAVRIQVDEGLSAIGLDHLVSTTVAGGDITDNSIVAYLASSSAQADWDSFVNITDSLQAIRDNQSGAGAGASPETFTIEHNGNPVDGAEVWVTSGSADSSTGILGGTLTTNAQGNVTFLLDGGSVWVWVQHAGYNFTNPTLKVI